MRLSSLVVEVGCASLSERAGVLWGKGVELLHAILQFSLSFPALLFTKTLGSLRAVTQVRTCHSLFLGGSSSVSVRPWYSVSPLIRGLNERRGANRQQSESQIRNRCFEGGARARAGICVRFVLLHEDA